MFARTRRLTLRPGWPEDASGLAQAIGHESVVRNLATAPWPYDVTDARRWLAASADGTSGIRLLIVAHEPAPHIIGTVALAPFEAEPHDLGYWITAGAWGRGYATEAAGAMLDIARSLRIGRITAGHFIDNPASGAVLRKLGFVPTGAVIACRSLARGEEVQSVEYALRLDAPSGTCVPSAGCVRRQGEDA